MGKYIVVKMGKSQTGVLLVQVLQYHYFLVVSAFFEREFPCLYCTFQRGFRLQIYVGMLLFFVYLSLQVEYAFLAAKHQDIFLCVHTLMCICVYLFGY